MLQYPTGYQDAIEIETPNYSIYTIKIVVSTSEEIDISFNHSIHINIKEFVIRTKESFFLSFVKM